VPVSRARLTGRVTQTGDRTSLDGVIAQASDTRATGALVAHRRCGATFRITFDDVTAECQS